MQLALKGSDLSKTDYYLDQGVWKTIHEWRKALPNLEPDFWHFFQAYLGKFVVNESIYECRFAHSNVTDKHHSAFSCRFGQAMPDTSHSYKRIHFDFFEKVNFCKLTLQLVLKYVSAMNSRLHLTESKTQLR